MLVFLMSITLILVGFTYLYFPAKQVNRAALGANSSYLVNWDPAFQTPAARNPADNATAYWHPHTRGTTINNAYISNGVLHTRQNNQASTGWSNYDNAVAQQGNFPWQDDCGHTPAAAPDWACPRNSYGLRTLAWMGANTTLSVNATFLARQGTGDYNIIIGVYFYFPNGPLTSIGGTWSYLEAQVRLATFKANGGLQPVGTEKTWNPDFDFGYAKTVATLQPGQSISLRNYDLHAFYVSAMIRRGLPPTTSAIILGLEPGTEGWGETLAVDFTEVSVTSYEPDAATADPDLDQAVNQNDLTIINHLTGTCPSDFGRYQWRADANSTNPCIDHNDLAKVEHYLGLNFQPSALAKVALWHFPRRFRSCSPNCTP